MPLTENDLLKYHQASLLLQRCSDMPAFSQAVMDSLRQLVPYDNGGFFYTDPITLHVGKACLVDLPAEAVKIYCAQYQRHDPHRLALTRTPPRGSDSTRVSDMLDLRQWDRTAIRRDFWLPLRAYYMVGINLVCQQVMFGRVNLHRYLEHGDFRDDEMTLLKLFCAQIEANYQRLQSQTLWQAAAPGLAGPGQGVLVFDAALTLLYNNAAAARLFTRMASLYEDLKGVCRHAAVLARATRNPLYSYSGILRRLRGSVTVYLLCCQAADGEARIMVMFTEEQETLKTPDGHQPLLTPREMEIIELLALGKTNAQISEALYITRETVKSHVSNLLTKFGVPSRTALIAKVLTPKAAAR